MQTVTLFLQARCSSWRPTNSVGALKAIGSDYRATFAVQCCWKPLFCLFRAHCNSSCSCELEYGQEARLREFWTSVRVPRPKLGPRHGRQTGVSALSAGSGFKGLVLSILATELYTGYILVVFYGMGLASVSCRRRWPLPTTLALTMLLG